MGILSPYLEFRLWQTMDCYIVQNIADGNLGLEMLDRVTAAASALGVLCGAALVLAL